MLTGDSGLLEPSNLEIETMKSLTNVADFRVTECGARKKSKMKFSAFLNCTTEIAFEKIYSILRIREEIVKLYHPAFWAPCLVSWP